MKSSRLIIPGRGFSTLSSETAKIAGKMPVPRGAILIVAMWVLVVLVGLVLVLGQTMRIEIASSANEFSTLQAQSVEQGAIQYVLYNLASLQGQMPLATNMPCEAVQVGKGAFWILRSNETTDDFTYCFGVTDECSKVNLNTADLSTLEMLSDMTSELAPCIIDWRTAGDTASPGGAKNDYYATLPDPYTCKEGPFETVEELFLVKGADADLMYGEDVNRSGVLETYKDGNKDGKLDRGLFPFVTVYSISPNTDANGNARVSVNAPPQIITTRNGRNVIRTYLPNAALLSLLQQKLSASRYQAVLTALTALLTKNPALQFRNVFDFYNKSGMTIDDFKLVADSLTNPSIQPTGLINVVTAPKEVLMCLPGLEDSDAAALIAQRITLGALSNSSTSASGGAGLSNSRLSSAMSSSPLSSGSSSGGLSGSSISPTTDLYNPWWVAQAITPQKAAVIGSRITTRSSRYSADIVSVSGDGRAFRRCRIVVDAQKTPKIIYRQDLTHLGWPLAATILTALKSGKTVDQLPLTSTAQGILK
jgi:type II secretory pathway component PulK